MKKILVAGCPGAGKSTFSRELQKKTGLPLYHLDRLFWNADKTCVSNDVFISRLEEILANDAWIIDGNYKSTLEMRLSHCDAVFFLDYSIKTCLSGIRERKGKPRPDMPWIENEDDHREMIEYIRTFHKTDRPAVLALLMQFPQIKQYVFHSRNEAEQYLASL